MYYVNAQQPNLNVQQLNAEVQDRTLQTDRENAGHAATRQLPGSQMLDVQDDGSQYRVHVRDHDGNYKTIVMDRDLKPMRTADGYC